MTIANSPKPFLINKPSTWFYTLVQHPGYVAVHIVFYKGHTPVFAEPVEELLADTSKENLNSYLLRVAADIDMHPTMAHATFIALSHKKAKILLL
jgi:hypothetical protein